MIRNMAEFVQFRKRAQDLVEKYGWSQRMVHPYGYGVSVGSILRDLNDYEKCTSASRVYLTALAEGLRGILDAWEAYELEPAVNVKILVGPYKGMVRKMKRSLAETWDMVEVLDGVEMNEEQAVPVDWRQS